MPLLIYDKRDGLALGSFPFLHKPSGSPSKPWVLSLVPSHATSSLPLPYSFRRLPRPALPSAPHRLLLCPTDIAAWQNVNICMVDKWLRCMVTWANLLLNQINISPIFYFLYWQWFHVPILTQLSCVHHRDAGLQGSLSTRFSWRGKKVLSP